MSRVEADTAKNATELFFFYQYLFPIQAMQLGSEVSEVTMTKVSIQKRTSTQGAKKRR